jgi:hypothetical protein
MDERTDLSFECNPTGRNGLVTLTAKLGDTVLAVENLNLMKPKARAKFIATVCDGRPGIDANMLDAELLKIAANLASRPKGKGGELMDSATLSELDTSRIVRPERFIVSEVSGLAVPSTIKQGEGISGRWRLYLRWNDGRREQRSLGSKIDLPGADPLWIYPEPCEPIINVKPGWSQEARMRWLDREPAPNPAEVFKELCGRIAYFLDLPKWEAPGVTATLACWVFLTYCYQAWPAVPYLYIGGPLGSGKSRVFEILNRLIFRPLTSSNTTAAALFRTLHTRGGTLLLDEAERLRDMKDPAVGEILSMLLAGYKQGGTATRLEPLGDNSFRTVAFEVFGPKALACIAPLPPALASRCIPVMMFRAAPGSDKPKRRIDEDPLNWQRLRDDLHVLAMEYGAAFLEMSARTDVCPTGIDGRNWELWHPLLAIAAWIEDHGASGLLKLLQDHALATIDAGWDEQTPDSDEILLRFLAEAVNLGERPEPGELLKKAQEAEPSAFKNWSPRAVTAHLKRYGIPTPKKSMGRRVFRDVTLEHLLRIQKNYGIDLDLSLPEEQTATAV